MTIPVLIFRQSEMKIKGKSKWQPTMLPPRPQKPYTACHMRYSLTQRYHGNYVGAVVSQKYAEK